MPKCKDDEIRDLVREKYGAVAEGKEGLGGSACCGNTPTMTEIQARGKFLDYREEDLLLAPGTANLGLGCGNPIGMAGLMAGEAVVDLGSGAGFDAFLASRQVGHSGHVIGLDMTAEMVQKAKENAEKLGVRNVDFRLGKIEALPVEDNTVDVVISNCVINLSPDKGKVFSEIHRVLKPGGRIVISDVLRSGEIPDSLRDNPAAYTG
ncbi:arsenite methyltransferase [Desulfatiglans anilini]|uniref:arsenite methyltransferase n=1 Tax=Desulfatiglans anilini TaxID=90728 RepID=UPI000410FEC0|nr:arsenite methyltransferase [Desulfatiglans anilini]